MSGFKLRVNIALSRTQLDSKLHVENYRRCQRVSRFLHTNTEYLKTTSDTSLSARSIELDVPGNKTIVKSGVYQLPVSGEIKLPGGHLKDTKPPVSCSFKKMYSFLNSLIVITTLTISAFAEEYCPSEISWPIAVVNATDDKFLGYVSSTLGAWGSFGLTNNGKEVLRFRYWSNCVADEPVYLSIENSINKSLGYASVVEDLTDCSQAKLPGFLFFAPSDGKPEGTTPPGTTLSTIHGGWTNPQKYCGENMIWYKDVSPSSWRPRWTNPGPGGPIIEPTMIYDPTDNAIIFADPVTAYPNSTRTTPIRLLFW
ncbi:hypothetical protein DL96DRAFT_1828636 [Flagelloscypha sp. PMI_526]|nr:hypothetical protein DL96DRAFT_1828636 [Flagelloscypha sp. PMI_526]